MKASNKNLSVFLPAYNEEKNLEAVVENVYQTLKKNFQKWELLIIDDGSTDDTGKIAKRISRLKPNMRYIYQTNGGYGMALRTGLQNSQYEYIAYIDSDGQFDFSQINLFFEKISSFDAVWGYRKKRNDPIARSIFSFLWNLTTKIFTGINLKDINCGFKLFRRKAMVKILPLTSTRGAMINPEIAIKLKKRGYKFTEVGVDHYPRKFGSPTGASLKVIVNSYFELLKLCLKTY